MGKVREVWRFHEDDNYSEDAMIHTNMPYGPHKRKVREFVDAKDFEKLQMCLRTIKRMMPMTHYTNAEIVKAVEFEIDQTLADLGLGEEK